MKKLLITLSAIAVTMLAFTATSDAGHQVRYLAGYDSCGRPVYCYKYVPTQRYSYGHIHRPSYRSYGHSYGYSSRSRGYSHRSYSGYSGRSYGGYSGRSYCR